MDGNNASPPLRMCPSAEQSLYKLEEFAASGRALETVLDILDYIKSKKITLAVLVSAICWHPSFPMLVQDRQIQYARTALTHMVGLKDWLLRLYKPPRRHDAGIDTEAAHDILFDFAMDVVSSEVNREMALLDPLMRAKKSDVSEQKLCSIKLTKMISEVSSVAPKTWAVLRKAACTPDQEKRNKYKVPEPVREEHHTERPTNFEYCRSCLS